MKKFLFYVAIVLSVLAALLVYMLYSEGYFETPPPKSELKPFEMKCAAGKCAAGKCAAGK